MAKLVKKVLTMSVFAISFLFFVGEPVENSWADNLLVCVLVKLAAAGVMLTILSKYKVFNY